MLINCTPHDITILDKSGDVVKKLAPSGIVARVQEIVVEIGDVEGVPTVLKGYGQTNNVPAKTEGFTYIVSYLVMQALNGSRPDCVCPDTGPESVVRVDGRVKGVRRFQK